MVSGVSRGTLSDAEGRSGGSPGRPVAVGAFPRRAVRRRRLRPQAPPGDRLRQHQRDASSGRSTRCSRTWGSTAITGANRRPAVTRRCSASPSPDRTPPRSPVSCCRGRRSATRRTHWKTSRRSPTATAASRATTACPPRPSWPHSPRPTSAAPRWPSARSRSYRHNRTAGSTSCAGSARRSPTDLDALDGVLLPRRSNLVEPVELRHHLRHPGRHRRARVRGRGLCRAQLHGQVPPAR